MEPQFYQIWRTRWVSEKKMVQLIQQKNKLKPLRPSLREKKRYIQYKITCEQNAGTKEMHTIIDTAILKYLGEFGYAKAGIKHLKKACDEKQGIGVFRLSTNMQQQVESALCLVTTHQQHDCRIEIQKISGVLKKITQGGK